MKKETRRAFLKKMVTASASAIWVALIPKASSSLSLGKKLEGTPEWMDHYYAYVVDTTPHFFEKEGVLTTIILTLLPFLVLFILSRFFPLGEPAEE